jgi:hypothetical protein
MSAGTQLEHGEGCSCARCTGFAAGHDLSLRHGAYSSSLRLSVRADELAGELRSVVPGYSPADEPAVRLLAIVLTRIEKATAALDRLDEAAAEELTLYVGDQAQSLQRLREDCRGWVNTARRLANDLGLTPTSRARLGLDVARTGDALERYLAEHYPEEASGA